MAPNQHAFRRSFSSYNPKAAEEVQRYIRNQEEAFKHSRFFLYKDVTKSCMIIPSLALQRYAQQKMSLRSVVDVDVMTETEIHRVINWWDSARLLVPIAIMDKPNSIYHALSLYMWGVHDDMLTLKKFVNGFVNGKDADVCRQHFSRYLCDLLDGPDCVDILATENVPNWSDIADLCSNEKQCMADSSGEFRDDASCFQEATACSSVALAFLLFILCNVIARPIVVHGVTGKALCDVAGIYLPLMRKSQNCERSPVLLLYHDNCFFPLLSCEDVSIPLSMYTRTDNSLHCVALCQSNLKELKLHFASTLNPTGNHCEYGILSCDVAQEYLDLSSMAAAETGNIEIPVLFLRFNAPPNCSLQLQSSWLRVIQEECGGRSVPLDDVQLCSRSTAVGCRNTGTSAMKGMCGQCYMKYLEVSQSVPKRNSLKKAKPRASSNDEAPIVTKNLLCIMPDCNRLQVEHLLNRCRECYLKHVESGHVKYEENERCCCYPNCSAEKLKGMDVCQLHLDSLEQSSAPYEERNTLKTTQNGAVNNPYCDPHGIHNRDLALSAHAHPITNGQGVPSDQVSTGSTTAAVSDEHAIRNMLDTFICDNDKQAGISSFKDPAVQQDEYLTEEFELYNNKGDRIGTEALQRCLVPECLHFVDSPGSLVCAPCAEEQKLTMFKLEEAKKGTLPCETLPKVCQTPQCALPAIGREEDYCMPCTLDQCPSDSDGEAMACRNAQHAIAPCVDDFTPSWRRCLTPGCDMYGSTKFHGLCSRCMATK